MEEPGIRLFGRYALSREIASGGMATVHFGRLIGPAGFGRTVAIKRLHPHLAKQQEFVDAFLDEARMAARIHHPNVVTTLDVITADDEVLLVMEYVPGDALSRILARASKSQVRIPPAIASGILVGALHGLHAAHEARTEQGAPLELVHRDVSPQNILVGADGVARVLDFGIAKARNRIQTTRDGSVKGKVAYMAPEQLSGMHLDRRTDVFAAGIVLWEAMAAARLFKGEDHAAIMSNVLYAPIPRLPADLGSAGLDAVLARALERDPAARFATALELATALEREIPPATTRVIAEWLAVEAAEGLEVRQRAVSDMERESSSPNLLAPAGDAPRGGAARKLAAAGEETLAASNLVPRPRAPGAFRGGAIGVGLLILAGMGAGGFALGAKRRTAATAATAATAVSAATAASAASAASAALPESTLAEPTADVARTPEALASSAATSATAPRTAPGAAPGAAKNAARSTTPHPAPKASCENPYVFDANGIRHIKAECVRP